MKEKKISEILSITDFENLNKILRDFNNQQIERLGVATEHTVERIYESDSISQTKEKIQQAIKMSKEFQDSEIARYKRIIGANETQINFLESITLKDVITLSKKKKIESFDRYLDDISIIERHNKLKAENETTNEDIKLIKEQNPKTLHKRIDAIFRTICKLGDEE